jgi:ferrous iron transport protein A
MAIGIGMDQMAVGETGRVVGLGRGNRSYREKLLSMGLTPGTEFTVVRLAPLGDPVEIAVRGYSVSLRKNEAEMLQVERL